jgi:hypothetical protein
LYTLYSALRKYFTTTPALFNAIPTSEAAPPVITAIFLLIFLDFALCVNSYLKVNLSVLQIYLRPKAFKQPKDENQFSRQHCENNETG